MLQPLRHAYGALRALRYPRIVHAVRAQALTYLDAAALNDLYRAVRRIERRSLAGSIIEAGCALGGSAIVLAAAKHPTRALAVYDVFGTIPPPSARDGADIHERYAVIASGTATGIGGQRYYGYRPDLIDAVRTSFISHGYVPENQTVSLVQGLFADTLHPAGPVVLAHLDGDWYDSTITCLERIHPHLVSGGIFVIDDYDHWSGCRCAVSDFLAAHAGQYRCVQRQRLQLHRR